MAENKNNKKNISSYDSLPDLVDDKTSTTNIFTNQNYGSGSIDSNENNSVIFNPNTSSTVLYLNVPSSSSNIVFGYDNDFFHDPYSELEEMKQKEESEQEMRDNYPALQEAWEQYQLIRKLVEEEEIDKYTKERYKTFKK